MIFVTGDCHGDWSKFSTHRFPDQRTMTRDDFVLVCGDFGIWHNTPEERYWLNWLAEKPFTICFVDGNHEHFDRLNSGEFPEVDFHGGRAHKIRDNIYHLMRGFVFELDGKKIFAFGGAQSHDIQDGILDIKDFPSEKELVREYRTRTKRGEMLRINHISWWADELPSEEEMGRGMRNLAKYNDKVDFIVSHCGPRSIVPLVAYGCHDNNRLTEYFDIVKDEIQFEHWYFGHYHDNTSAFNKFVLLYDDIIRVN